MMDVKGNKQEEEEEDRYRGNNMLMKKEIQSNELIIYTPGEYRISPKNESHLIIKQEREDAAIKIVFIYLNITMDIYDFGTRFATGYTLNVEERAALEIQMAKRQAEERLQR